MLIDDVLNKVADAVTGSAEESGCAFDTVKRVIADGYLMLVVLAEFNRGKEGVAVIFEFALALLGGGGGLTLPERFRFVQRWAELRGW